MVWLFLTSSLQLGGNHQDFLVGSLVVCEDDPLLPHNLVNNETAWAGYLNKNPHQKKAAGGNR